MPTRVFVSAPPTGPTIVRKTADETVLNSAVLQNDDHLLLAIAASEVWAVDFVFIVTGAISATPDFKFAVTVPVAAACSYGLTAEVANAATATDVGTAIPATAMSVDIAIGEVKLVRVRVVVTNGANAGNVQLQWAQNAATVDESITVKANSYLIAHKLA